jgi:hypothetical protein
VSAKIGDPVHEIHPYWKKKGMKITDVYATEMESCCPFSWLNLGRNDQKPFWVLVFWETKNLKLLYI